MVISNESRPPSKFHLPYPFSAYEVALPDNTMGKFCGCQRETFQLKSRLARSNPRRDSSMRPTCRLVLKPLTRRTR